MKKGKGMWFALSLHHGALSLHFVQISEGLVPLWCAIVVIAYFDVELAEVVLALSACDGAVNDVSFSYIQVFFHVEDCLFPVGILLIGRGGEHDRALQSVKWCVEPGNETVNAICVLHAQLVLA